MKKWFVRTWNFSRFEMNPDLKQYNSKFRLKRQSRVLNYKDLISLDWVLTHLPHFCLHRHCDIEYRIVPFSEQKLSNSLQLPAGGVKGMNHINKPFDQRCKITFEWVWKLQIFCRIFSKLLISKLASTAKLRTIISEYILKKILLIQILFFDKMLLLN